MIDKRGGNVFSSSFQTDIFDSSSRSRLYVGGDKQGLDFKEELIPSNYTGKVLVVFYPNGSYRAYPTPCFFEPYGMFVSKDGQWVSFQVDVGIERHNLGLVKFIKDIGYDVYQLLLRLCGFMEGTT